MFKNRNKFLLACRIVCAGAILTSGAAELMGVTSTLDTLGLASAGGAVSLYAAKYFAILA